MAKRTRKTDTPEGKEPDAAKAFIVTAMNKWRTADTAEGGGVGSMRYEGELDKKFLNLQQWDENDERDRLSENKPTLVIDQIGEPYRQLTGQLRRAKPAIQFNPVDNGADVDVAEIAQGLYRHIEITGNAKAARDEGAKGMCGPGLGYYRLVPEFEYDQETTQANEDGTLPAHLFDQCIKYQPIENQFSVFRDPACPTYEPWKARFCFIVENVPLDTFKERWPAAVATSDEAFQATGVSMPEWYPEGSVRVADYFYVEEKPGNPVALLADGRVVPLELAPDGVAILQQRTPTIRTVKLAKITGAAILDGNEDKTAGRDFPADYIPVIPMYGESIIVDGKRTLKGIVRAARDSQRMYNFHASELVYELALAPKSKVIMAEGQDEGYEQMWQQAPVKAFPALKYKPTALGGERVPEPKVAQFTDPAKIQAITIALNQNKADLRSTTGWYDSTDPNRKNADQSGRAILARKEAQAEGSVNYTENFGAALYYEAMVGWSMIRRLYTRPGRVLRIVGMEDETQTEEVVYGQPLRRKGKKAQAQQQALAQVFTWGAGRYDFTISIGASYTTRRQEAAETQMKLVEVLAGVSPPMAAAITPAAIRNLDIPGARELADIAERTLPPEIRGDDEGAEDDPEQLKAKVQQLTQQNQEAMQVVQGLQEAIKTDQVKAEADLQKTQMSAQADAQKTQQQDQTKLHIAEMEIASKERIEAAKIDAEFRLAQMKIEADLQKAQLAAMSAAANQQADQAHQRGMAGAQAGQAQRTQRESFAHDDLAADRSHQQAMEQQASQPEAGA